MTRSPSPDKVVHVLSERVSDINRIWLPIRLQPPTPPKSHEVGDARSGYTYAMYLSDYEQYLLALSTMKHVYLRTQRRDGTGIVDMSIARKSYSGSMAPSGAVCSFVAVDDEDDSSTVTGATSASVASTRSFVSSYEYGTTTTPARSGYPDTTLVTAVVRTGGSRLDVPVEKKKLRRKEKRLRARARRAAQRTSVETSRLSAKTSLESARLDLLRTEQKVKKEVRKVAAKKLSPSAAKRKAARLAKFGPPKPPPAQPET